jgi:hypothetical protein
LAFLVNCGVVEVKCGVLIRAGPLEWLELGVIIRDNELASSVVYVASVLLAIDFLGIGFVSVADLLCQVFFEPGLKLLLENLRLDLLGKFIVKLLLV